MFLWTVVQHFCIHATIATNTMQDGVFGLHSFRVGALTAAANTGLFTPMQLQNMGRWAQLDSAARYFLPREKEKMKVGMELGNQLAKAMKEEVLEAAGSRKVAWRPVR